MKARNSRTNPEELKKVQLENELREIKESINRGILPLNTTRYFDISERAQWGAHKEVYIREIGDEHLYYLVESINVVRDRDKPAENELHYLPWIDIHPFTSGNTRFTKEERYFIRLSNSDIYSLLSMVYSSHAGVDFDVEYQRDHVWEMEN